MCRSAPRLPDGRDGSRREEVRLGLLEPLAGYEDVHGFVVERDQAGDGQELAGWKVVGPREILVDRVAHADRPISACRALVRAASDGAAWRQVLEVDLRRVEVVPGGQAGLEDHDRR